MIFYFFVTRVWAKVWFLQVWRLSVSSPYVYRHPTAFAAVSQFKSFFLGQTAVRFNPPPYDYIYIYLTFLNDHPSFSVNYEANSQNISSHSQVSFLDYMERYEQYHRVFDRFDYNGDGKICPVELQQCVASMGGKMRKEEAEAAVALADSDGDGLLCFEDFVRIIEGAGEEDKASDLKEAFKMYVEAEAGYCITAKSLRRMLSRLGERTTVDDCKNMIARFDINKDGVLSFEEFKVMMSR
ncbi:Polcalcin Jun o [Dorcoceras hygrometricum]|uniref:Polcalcin Jun o n=1 Tax=Dorcoceras hygrometricum TaxID=472368 RepID=A0A2Z7CBN4_9LAMI|nr:Polcalcin Jun o [Dorcoceras hygrometricum]